MYDYIKTLSEQYDDYVKQIRRDFHKYAEKGWLEVRTACIIASTLEDLDRNDERTRKEFDDLRYFDIVKNGMTSVASVLRTGDGPNIAFRFDIDTLELNE